MKRFAPHIAFIFLYIFSPGYAYEVNFEGVPSQEICETMESVSELISQQKRPPPTLFTLKRRAESDKKNLIQVLHAFGYYEASVTIDTFGPFPDTQVRVEIDPGPQYLFGTLEFTEEAGGPLLVSEASLDLQVGCPARSDVILDTEDQILDQLACIGYPLAEVSDRSVVVDQEAKTVNVTYGVMHGPLAYFGPTTIEGLHKVRRRYVRRKILWGYGELYNPNKVECTDTYLQESGLFSIVTVRPDDTVDENGLLPMLISIEEKKYRHIGAGVSYSTDESVGGMFQWSHDNLTGWGDAFAFTSEFSEIVKRATLFYVMPDFYGRNQDLLYSAEVRREDAPGFTEREGSLYIRLNKKVNDVLTFNYGGRYERLLSTKSDNDENYNLLSAPIQVRWDTSNRLLDPTKGITIAFFSTPSKAIFNSHIFFLRQELFAAAYHSITPSGGIILAGFAQLGSIIGQSRILIPAPKRFYAGSSTSLRGYKYLSVSPLSGKKPIGGRSLMIFSVEPRFRIWKQLYLAGFFDAGNVYATPMPRLHEKLLRSSGVGFRYLTPVGPFRLDIAFPLDKREGIDKTFQIYASIGQTF